MTLIRFTAVVAAIAALGAASAAPAVASDQGSGAPSSELRKKGNKGPKSFLVCKRGCQFRTIQDGANAAGKYQFRSKKKAVVKVKPGTYKEGVLLHGKRKGYNFDGLSIIGVKKNGKPNPSPKGVILEGKGAKVIVLVPGRMVKETVLETG